MIIIADTPYLDAFMHAKQASQEIGNLKFFNSSDNNKSNGFDIFFMSNKNDVGFISSVESESELERAVNWSLDFKMSIFWNCKTEKLKKIADVKNLKHKTVSIPNYVNLSNSLSSIKSELPKASYEFLSNEIGILPIPEKLHRDQVSSFLHKVAVIGSDLSGNIYGSDVLGKRGFSFIDLTNFFCKNFEEFYKFCIFYFDEKNEEHFLTLRSWMALSYSLCMCDFNCNHEKIKDFKYLSPKTIEVISSKLNGLVAEKDKYYFIYSMSIVQSLKNLDDLIYSCSIIRSCLSGNISKKNSINIIRSFYE